MGEFMKLLDISDIDKLDEKQLNILRARARDIIMHEICSNQQIRNILHPLIKDLYDKLTPRGGTQPTGSTPPPQTTP